MKFNPADFGDAINLITNKDKIDPEDEQNADNMFGFRETEQEQSHMDSNQEFSQGDFVDIVKQKDQKDDRGT